MKNCYIIGNRFQRNVSSPSWQIVLGKMILLTQMCCGHFFRCPCGVVTYVWQDHLAVFFFHVDAYILRHCSCPFAFYCNLCSVCLDPEPMRYGLNVGWQSDEAASEQLEWVAHAEHSLLTDVPWSQWRSSRCKYLMTYFGACHLPL